MNRTMRNKYIIKIKYYDSYLIILHFVVVFFSLFFLLYKATVNSKHNHYHGSVHENLNSFTL